MMGRVIAGIRHAFPARWHEWIMGVWIVVWGAGLIADPADNFAAPSWALLRTIAGSDGVFGAAMIGIGAFRLLALAINGTFHDTVYSRYSPVVRGVTAALCGWAWFAVMLSVLPSGVPAALTYPFPFAIEVFAAWFIAGEAGLTIRAHHADKPK